MSAQGVDLQRLPDYLQSQRWFGSKGLPIKNISVVEHMEIKSGADSACPLGVFVLAIIEVAYEIGQPERYQLLVCPQPDGSLASAIENEAFARLLLEIIREERVVASGANALHGLAFPQSQPRLSRIPPGARVRPIVEEQSNSSVVFDEQAILKVIRKIESGLNPELEIGRFLLSRPEFKGAPALLGALQIEGPTSATLAVLHEHVLAEDNGWRHVLDAFRASPKPGADLLSAVARLGSVLAGLHLTLASDPNDPAFCPEPIQQEDLQRWSSSIIGELGVTFAEVEKRMPELGSLRDPLVETAKRLAQAPPSGKKIRLHGDLHLGQVLRVRGDWMIFDFEGEPARSFHQRREKHTPLKDVAGMIRSFEYAQAAVELEGAAPGDRAGACRDAFLEAYLSGLGGSDLLPRPDAFSVVLTALELERTVYELRYEMQSRPDWVRIPLRTLQKMGTAT
jgi:trehalose synthase-fused probable maltokinase